MARARMSMPPEAIRIEDEVWQEAFTRREPSPSRAARRLRALEGGLADPADVPRPASPAHAERPVSAPRASRPVPAPSARRPSELAVAPTPNPETHPDDRLHAGAGEPARRTVTIRGRGAERNLPWPDGSRRRPQRRAYERTGFNPDRVAMWAVLLGILLVIVAVASAH